MTGNNIYIKSPATDEEKLKVLIQKQPDLVCFFLPDTTLIFVNEAYARFFNKSTDELIGTKWLELIPVSEHPRVLKHIKSITAINHTHIYEHSLLSYDGAEHWHEWTDCGIFDEDNNLIELFGSSLN